MASILDLNPELRGKIAQATEPGEDPYKKFYETVSAKSLADSPAWRAYTMGARDVYNPTSSAFGQNPDWTWDENTGYGYMLDPNKKMYGPVPIEGEKQMNLVRFFINPYTGSEQTYDVNLKKDGTKQPAFAVGKTIEEQKENIFKDLYIQNLVKHQNDREKAYAETLDIMNKRVEPILSGKFYQFMKDPQVNRYMKTAVDTWGSGMSVDPAKTKTQLRSALSAMMTDKYPYGTKEFYNFTGINPKDPNPIAQKKFDAKVDMALPWAHQQVIPVLTDYLVNYKGISQDEAERQINEIFMPSKKIPTEKIKLK